MYYGWSKEFLEAGKRRLAGDTARAATSDEVKDLRREASALKEVVADLTLENRQGLLAAASASVVRWLIMRRSACHLPSIHREGEQHISGRGAVVGVAGVDVEHAARDDRSRSV